MAHCFTITDKVTDGITLTPSKDDGLFIDCGLDAAESVRMSTQWTTNAIGAQLHTSSILEGRVNELKERGADESTVAAAMVPLRECRYGSPIIDRAAINEDGTLEHPRTAPDNHRTKWREALIHLCPQDIGSFRWTANTYSECIYPKRGYSVDREYHPIADAVGVSVLCSGPSGMVITMYPHASIRFERSGDTKGEDVRVMLKWMFPRISWRTLRAAPGQRLPQGQLHRVG